MSEAIGIRFDEDFLKKIEVLSKEEVSDKSTTIRKLAYLGYQNLMGKKTAEDYKKGKITMSQATAKAEISVWEMEQFLVQEGYKSSYSIEDLRAEMGYLGKVPE